MPYWSGDEEGDVYEGDIALPRTGSDEPVDMLEYRDGPGGPVAPVMRKVTFMTKILNIYNFGQQKSKHCENFLINYFNKITFECLQISGKVFNHQIHKL